MQASSFEKGTGLQTLRARMRKKFGRYSLYQRLRTSLLGDLYRRLGSRDGGRETEMQFYRSVLQGLRKDDLIFDVGANGGDKTDLFLRLGARVVAVEPDETNQNILAQRFLRLRLFQRPVTIVGKAASDSLRNEIMCVEAPGSALNTLSRKWVNTLRSDQSRFATTPDFAEERSIQTTTLDDLISKYGAPFYAKIDVEGHEPEVLRGLHRPLPYVSFEVNLPQFTEEGLECIERLDQLDTRTRFNCTLESSEGLVLREWMGKPAFISHFKAVAEPSIEIFATTRY